MLGERRTHGQLANVEGFEVKSLSQLFFVILVVVLTLVGRMEEALAVHCARCGCDTECQKVCRLVCEDKKIEVFCWGCKCEDFCVPGPSKPGCSYCDTVCGSCENCDPKQPCAEPKNFLWTQWIPGWGKVYTRTKLMRKTETVTIPSHKWVVEEVCCECAAIADGKDLSTDSETLPAPADQAK